MSGKSPMCFLALENLNRFVEMTIPYQKWRYRKKRNLEFAHLGKKSQFSRPWKLMRFLLNLEKRYQGSLFSTSSHLADSLDSSTKLFWYENRHFKEEFQ